MCINVKSMALEDIAKMKCVAGRRKRLIPLQEVAEPVPPVTWIFDEGVVLALSERMDDLDWVRLTSTCSALRKFKGVKTSSVMCISRFKDRVTIYIRPNSDDFETILGSLPVTVVCVEIFGLSKAVTQITIPHGVEEVILHSVDESVIPIKTCGGVKSLTLPDRWDFPIYSQYLPKNLVRLELGRFHQSEIQLWDLTSLEVLRTGKSFDQLRSTFPEGLRLMMFGLDFNEKLKDLRLPSTVQALKFCRKFKQNLTDLRIPESLTTVFVTSLGNTHLSGHDKFEIKMWRPTGMKNRLCIRD